MKLLSTAAIALMAAFLPSMAHAAVDSGDTAWILTSTALVLFMTMPGLALFYASLAQPRNLVSVLMHHFALACACSVAWVVIGYSLAFSDSGVTWIGGVSNFMMTEITLFTEAGTIPESLFAAFQMTFAVITPALIIGAYTGRMNFLAVIAFSILWLLVVYAPVTKWVWGGGFMAEWGVMDFAGGIVVHTTAGVGALVVAMVLGRRRNFPKRLQPPNSPFLTMIGASMLWVGWFGFNGGSALAAGQGAAMALLVTHIAASIGALIWMVIEWSRGRTSVVDIATGLIAGLATVTPASGYIGIPGAVVLGLVGGFACFYAVGIIRRKLLIDDALDVFAVHGVGGILGTLLVAVLATDAFSGGGINLDSVGEQFMVQLACVAITIVWTVVATYIILKLVGFMTPLRVADQMESEGLDLSQHGETNFRQL